MARVLYISYDGMTDPLGQSQVIPYLEGLAEEGFDITLLSCEKRFPYRKYGEEITKQLKNAGIKWEVVSYSKKPPILSTLYDLFKIRRKAYALHKKEKFQIIHCRSYISAFVGVWMKHRFDTRFLFDMRGFWADERVEGGLWNIRNPLYKNIYRIFKHKESDFLSEADFIVCLTLRAKEEILSWKNLSIDPAQIAVIPCCVDLNLFDRGHVKKALAENLRRSLNIKEENFVLLYLGSTGTWYMLNEMLHFFKQLLLSKPLARFLFVTKDNPEVIIHCAIKYNIPLDSIIITSAERKELPSLIAISGVAIFFIKPVYSKKASSPTKQGEIMGMGVPIICNDGVGDTTMIIKEANAGIVIEHFTEAHYRKVIKNLNLLVKKDKNQIREGALKYFSLNDGIEKYSNIYRNLLN